jgi:hypothetical protein
MTAPTFDAHGWCHDMDAAPKDANELLLWVNSYPVIGWWQKAYPKPVGVWRSADGVRADPTAWRPLPLPPVGAE